MQNGEIYITINGVQHWCRVAGAEHNTVPLVVIHGGPGGNVYAFERTIGPLLEQFATIVYYDQRGCGRSAAPARPDEYSLSLLVSDLEALCDRLGPRQITPLGFSFGGELALAYALAHPQRAHKLILQAPSVADSAHTASVQLHGFESVATGTLKTRVQAVLRAGIAPEQGIEQVWEMVDRETVDRFLFQNPDCARLNRRLWDESGLGNTGDMRKALLSQPRPPGAGRSMSVLSAPTLVMVGRHDRNVGIDVCRRLTDAIRGAKLVVFEASAHFPDIEEPAQYAAAVQAFLTETPSDSPQA